MKNFFLGGTRKSKLSSSFKTLISIISIIIMAVFGYLLNDNKNLQNEIQKKETVIKSKELVIVQLEGKIVDQETKISILSQDNESMQLAITSLEKKARDSSIAAQEAVERMLELAKIERGISAPAAGGSEEEENTKPVQVSKEEPAKASSSNEQEKTAAGKENSKKADVVNDSSSKKFIELRNNIYNRYK